METMDAKDGFSFRPQREKRNTSALPLSPPRQWQKQQQQHNTRRTPHLRHNPGNECRVKYPLLEYTDDVQVQMEAEDHFNKSFTFSPITNKTLPPLHTMYTTSIWQNEELQKMKNSLNAVKEQLSTKDVSIWHTHTTNTNPSQRICYAVKRRAQPEMLTQAWLKFYEIANAYTIVPLNEERDGSEVLDLTIEEESRESFTSVHLCEAPGAFISALNHYLTLNHPSVKWHWLGNTLNPYYEGMPLSKCIVDDRLIIHTLDNWCFGADNTGDLMSKNTLSDLIKRTEDLPPVKLVTADGSFDCQANPAEQETMTHPLHVCEAAAALSILAEGGTLVLKKFTLFESETVCLVYLLRCVFDELHVYKPATSKQGNSEVYLIGINYYGRKYFNEHLDKIIEASWCAEKVVGKAMFRLDDIPGDFIDEVKECASKFVSYQVRSIRRNLELFEDTSERQKQLNDLLKTKATALFFERNYCAPIHKWQTVTHGLANKSRPLMESDWNKVSSSLLMRSQSFSSKLDIITDFLTNFTNDFTDENESVLVEGTECYLSSFTPQASAHLKIDLVRGKPLRCIESSKFCSERILRLTRELEIMLEMKCCSTEMKVKSEDIHKLNLDTEALEMVGKMDDSLSACVLASHPDAIQVKGEGMHKLHPGTQALEQIFALIIEGKLNVGTSVLLTSAPLLSRMQYSLLVILATVFEEVLVYRCAKIGRKLPVLVLKGFKSKEPLEEVVRELDKLGWRRKGGRVLDNVDKDILQVISLQCLLSEKSLVSVYNYNVYMCAHIAHVLLLNILQESE